MMKMEHVVRMSSEDEKVIYRIFFERGKEVLSSAVVKRNTKID